MILSRLVIYASDLDMIIKLQQGEVNTMLTTKQEMFVQELIKGKSQREAYKTAYDCEKMKDENIDSKASNLFANVKVRARYEELIAKGAEKALWTREQAINDLVEIKNTCLQALSRESVNEETGESIKLVNSKMATGAINAIKELNNMNGFNEQKIDVKSDSEINVNIKVV